MPEIVFDIEPVVMRHCSRCTYATSNENAMRSHILRRQCPKQAQYYTERKAG